MINYLNYLFKLQILVSPHIIKFEFLGKVFSQKSA